MPTPRRSMALTPELVARAARLVEDAGPSPGAVYLTDAGYDALGTRARLRCEQAGAPQRRPATRRARAV